MFSIDQIEFHITHTCNFKCDGCAHYSNYGVKGFIPFVEGARWLIDWSQRLSPERFKILGGEPTLHTELISYVKLVGDLWPKASRVLTTNGYFLDRHPQLPEVLASTDTLLYLTFHSNDPIYLRKIVPITRTWSKLSRSYGFRFEVGDGREVWLKSYKGIGNMMSPYNEGAQRASWETCISKFCSQLHQNRIWKCPCLAYLNTISERFALDLRPEWQPYLAYNGIGLDASDQELELFLKLQDEHYCNMCPSKPVQIDKNINLNNDICHYTEGDMETP